jgi:hypothetical protein
MKRNEQIWYLILLLPAIIESIDHKIPTITFGPFSIGKMSLIIIGLILTFQYPKVKNKSRIYLGLIIMVIGNLIAGIINNEMDSVTRAIAFGLLLIGANGLTVLFSAKYGKYGLMVFFVASFFYWTNYMGSLFFSGGSINAYSELFLEGEAINHHFVGMNISMAGLFSSIYFFYKDGNMKIFGYVGIVVAAVVCFMSESRSNTLFTIFGLVLLLLLKRKNLARHFFILTPIVLLSAYFTNGLLNENDVLSQRFDVNDLDYQERTTIVRVEMIEAAFTELANNPLGKGIKNIYVKVRNRNLNIHNQYLTFIIGGGIVGLIGVLIWISAVYSNLIFYLRKGNVEFKRDSYYTAIIITTTIFHITLTTLEFSTLLFFLIISISILLEERINSHKSLDAHLAKQSLR